MLVLTALVLGVGLALGVHHLTWRLRLHHPSAAGLLGGAVAVPFALMTLAAVASFVWNGTLPSEVVGIIAVGLAVIWVLAGALGGLHA